MPLAVKPSVGSGYGDKLFKGLNDARVNGRQALADLLDTYAGVGQPTVVQEGLHRKTSENLTNALGQVLPPNISATLADAAGIGNEVLSGTLFSMRGHPFYSEEGYDPTDIDQNRIGQAAAQANLEQNPPILAKAIGAATGLDLADKAVSKGTRLLGAYMGDRIK